MIKEIEVKAKVKDFAEIINQLEKLGCVFSEAVVQKDRIYLPQGLSFEGVVPGTTVLRIREQNGKAKFTLKQRQKVELSKIEKELDISNPDIMHEIIELLEFKEALTIIKKRKKTRYKDYEVCLDEVEGLGTFIEVEKMSEEDGEKVQKELFEFLKTLGISEEDKEIRSYDTMLYYQGKI